MLGDLRIRTRVLAIVASALLASLLLGAAALWGIHSLRHGLDRVSNQQCPGTVLLAEMGQSLETAARAVNVLLVRDTATDQVLRTANHAIIEKELQQIRATRARLLELHPEYRDDAEFNRLDGAVDAWRKSVIATQAAARAWEAVVL